MHVPLLPSFSKQRIHPDHPFVARVFNVEQLPARPKNPFNLNWQTRWRWWHRSDHPTHGYFKDEECGEINAGFGLADIYDRYKHYVHKDSEIGPKLTMPMRLSYKGYSVS